MRIGPIIMDTEQQFSQLADQIAKDMKKDFPEKGSKAMEAEARRHVQARYPGSEHWNPAKINAHPEKNAASIDVDVAGSVRNYWDVNIYPVDAPSLVYPTEEGHDTYGLREWRDIYTLLPNHNWFEIRKDPEHGVIAAIMGGSLVALFHLRQHVFQKQDPTLLPTDETFCAAICTELMK